MLNWVKMCQLRWFVHMSNMLSFASQLCTWQYSLFLLSLKKTWDTSLLILNHSCDFLRCTWHAHGCTQHICIHTCTHTHTGWSGWLLHSGCTPYLQLFLYACPSFPYRGTPHCHKRHDLSLNICVLQKLGFKGRIYATEPTMHFGRWAAVLASVFVWWEVLTGNWWKSWWITSTDHQQTTHQQDGRMIGSGGEVSSRSWLSVSMTHHLSLGLCVAF